MIKAAATGPVHTHSHFAALKIKDAVADHFRDISGKRPDVEIKNPDVVIHLRIYNNEISLSLDSSGQPLNKRGYRPREAEAPLNECLAAGMLMLADYEGKTNFVDGMCGSGTLAIEAALIANRIAPGLLRDDFSFMHWNDFDPELFEVIREATVNRIGEKTHEIVAFDNDIHAIRLAKEAAETAKLDDVIDFRHADFMLEPPLPAPGFLALNPPYGERIRTEDIEELYERIGSRLKEAYPGYRAWVISGNIEAMYKIGLRTFQTYHLLNGKIECRYSGYQIYSGSRTPKAETAQ
ncbi:MAG: THUMP domain-containing protein [Flavobacteriales bacterium]|nr:THUMP domain-containing protein [Flavobacteriales bacterium]